MTDFSINDLMLCHMFHKMINKYFSVNMVLVYLNYSISLVVIDKSIIFINSIKLKE